MFNGRRFAARARALAMAVLMIAAALTPTAAAAQAQAASIRGEVRSVVNEPLAGVEVTLSSSGAIVRTNDAGVFRFMSAPLGLQALTFRRIGLLPAAVGVNVSEKTEPVAITMIAARQSLDTVRVVAQLNVLAGIVVDSLYRPIPGASVDVVGTARAQTETDSSGWFSFTSLQSGPVVVRARKSGYVMDTHSMILEDWRGLMLRLDALPADAGSVRRMYMSGIGPIVESIWLETRHRLTVRGSRSVIVSREELAPFGTMSLGEVIPLTQHAHAFSTELAAAYGQLCVVQNGRTPLGLISLDHFKASDVDFVELYPPKSEPTGSIAAKLRRDECAAQRSVVLTASRGLFYAVVWLR